MYGQEFHVPVASLLESTDDTFENYTLSSLTTDAADEIDDVTIWWDRLDKEFGGLFMAGPKSGPAVWLIDATMQSAGETDSFYSLVIEIDIAGDYDDPGTDTSPTIAPTGVIAPTQAPSKGVTPRPSSDVPKPATTTQKPSSAAGGVATAPVVNYSNSSTVTAPVTSRAGSTITPPVVASSRPSSLVLVSSTFSSPAAAGSGAAANGPFVVEPGESFVIPLGDLTGNPTDKVISYTATTDPAGYDTSWILYNDTSASFYGVVPTDYPSLSIVLQIVIQRLVNKRRELAFSVDFGLFIRSDPEPRADDVVTATLWSATTALTTDTCDEEAGVTAAAAAVLAVPAAVLLAFDPLTNQTVSVPANTTTTKTVFDSRGPTNGGPSAVPLSTVVVTTCDSDLDDVLVTEGAAVATGVAPGTARTGSGVQTASGSVSLLPVTAGATGLDSTSRLPSMAVMIFGFVFGAWFLI